jgi:integrase
MPRLTDISVRQLPVPLKGQRLYYDEVLPGFGCRVSQGGTRSFFVQHGANRQFTTIGRHPVISLAEARTEAKRILAERTLGRHRPQSISWKDALTLFLSVCEQKNKARTVRDYKRLLTRHFSFGSQLLADITPQDINRRIDRLQKTVSEQNHALVAVKVFFRWAQRRHYITHSPCEGMQTIRRQPRQRILSDAELVAVYKTAEKIGPPFGAIVQLCILTGQRRSEIAWLRRSYFENNTCTFPASFTKNKREHTFPIGKLAQAVVDKTLNDTDFLFPAQRGDTVFGGWSKCKTAFDKACPIAPWTLHDLRRTFATNLAALGTPIHVTERLLNHISGTTTGGLIAVYQRHSYMDEMRAAILAWERRLEKLLS